jgi:hypothetical protein
MRVPSGDALSPGSAEQHISKLFVEIAPAGWTFCVAAARGFPFSKDGEAADGVVGGFALTMRRWGCGF